MDISNAIMKIKEETGLNQKEIGEKIGVTGNAVSSWKKGKYIPSKKIQDRLDGFIAESGLNIHIEYPEKNTVRLRKRANGGKIDYYERQKRENLIDKIKECFEYDGWTISEGEEILGLPSNTIAASRVNIMGPYIDKLNKYVSEHKDLPKIRKIRDLAKPRYVLMYMGRRGKTKPELLKAIGICGKSFTNWQKGKSKPKMCHILQISAFLDIEPEKMVYGDEWPRIKAQRKEKENKSVKKTIGMYQIGDHWKIAYLVNGRVVGQPEYEKVRK